MMSFCNGGRSCGRRSAQHWGTFLKAATSSQEATSILSLSRSVHGQVRACSTTPRSPRTQSSFRAYRKTSPGCGEHLRHIANSSKGVQCTSRGIRKHMSMARPQLWQKATSQISMLPAAWARGLHKTCQFCAGTHKRNELHAQSCHEIFQSALVCGTSHSA